MQNFTDENDAELLLFMSMENDDPAAAREAWAEFYERHAEYLQAVCWRAYADFLNGEAGVGDLVAETFRRAFERAATFSCEESADPDAIRRRVRAWLARIAERLCKDMLRRRGRLGLFPLDQDALEQIPEPAAEPVVPGTDLERVQVALNQLSEREQLVIRVTFQWYQPGREHQRLPNDVVDELANALGTTPENLRQIRRRALERIRRALKTPLHREVPVPTGDEI